MPVVRLIPFIRLMPLVLVVGLAACAGTQPFKLGQRRAAVVADCDSAKVACPTVKAATRSKARLKNWFAALGAAKATLPGAVDADSLDTATTAEIKAATAATSVAGEKRLGKTIASLGDVGVTGFWLETPFVDAISPGRVVWAANGNSVQVELRPRDGPRSAGSQISLAAMRALGLPLTALPELIVIKQ